MLKALFSSLARVKILRIFLLSEEGHEYFVRELTRELDEQINSIRRELENLEKIGMLQSRMRERKKYYRINSSFPLLKELRSMFQKGEILSLNLLKKLDRMGKLDLLVLTGFFIGEEANVDLIVVGSLDKEKLFQYLSGQLVKDLKKEIKYSIFTREDFLYRLECKDKFSRDIFRNKKNILLVNRIEKEIEESQES